MLSNDQIKIYNKLGIPLDYGEKNNLVFYNDAIDLVDVRSVSINCLKQQIHMYGKAIEEAQIESHAVRPLLDVCKRPYTCAFF